MAPYHMESDFQSRLGEAVYHVMSQLDHPICKAYTCDKCTKCKFWWISVRFYSHIKTFDTLPELLKSIKSMLNSHRYWVSRLFFRYFLVKTGLHSKLGKVSIDLIIIYNFCQNNKSCSNENSVLRIRSKLTGQKF